MTKDEWDKLGISNDFLFGKIMRNPVLCKELLRRVLPDLEIDHVEYPETQKSIKPDMDARSVRLDVYVRDKKHRVYDIEMQTTDTKEIPKRSRYYQSMLDLQMIDKGQTYKHLNPSYVIFICLSDIFAEGRHIYTFKNTCVENPALSLNDDTTKIFMNANGRINDVSKELKAFLDYVAGKKSADVSDSYVLKLDEAVREAKKNRKWRHEYMTLLMRDQENLEKGIKKGIKKGMEKGIKKGMEKGKIYGMIAAYRELNFSEEQISKKIQEKFKLSKEEVIEYLNGE